MLGELLQLLGNFLFVGHLAQGVYVDIPTDALAVDDDDRPLRPTDLLVEHAVRLRHPSMRPEVGAERVLDAAERLSPRLQRVHRIAEDAHDLGLATGEALLERVQRGSFAVSGFGEREREERDDNTLPAECGELDLAPIVGPEREVRCGVADLESLRLARDLRPTFWRGHAPRLAACGRSMSAAGSPSIGGRSIITRSSARSVVRTSVRAS